MRQLAVANAGSGELGCPSMTKIAQSKFGPGGPSVSVGMPVYNGERFIRRAIESILTQDYEDFELIIADNASTDATGEICRSYADRDQRVRYIRNESNIGAAPNHKRVFQMARGMYFKWAAHDDECRPTLLSSCVKILAGAAPSVVLVYPQSDVIDEEGRTTREYRTSIEAKDPRPHRRLARVLRSVVLGTPMYGVMRASVLRQTRLIDAFLGSDFVLFAELAMLGEIWELPEALLRKRFYSGRSFEANKTAQEYAAWLDPRYRKRQVVLANCHKLAFEYVKSALRLPLSPSDRVKCAISGLYSHYARHNEERVERWKRRLGWIIGVQRRDVGNIGVKRTRVKLR
jgi:glycosyltransferase involved in cell wall biosynthesis